MIPDAQELMPDLEREVILREAKHFDPLTRLEDFTKRFPLAMQTLHIGGVHPTENSSMDNPYTGEPDNKSSTNVGEHCVAAACFAEVIAKELKQREILTQAGVDQATEEALKHDVNKRIDVFRKDAAVAGKLPVNDVY